MSFLEQTGSILALAAAMDEEGDVADDEIDAAADELRRLAMLREGGSSGKGKAGASAGAGGAR